MDLPKQKIKNIEFLRFIFSIMIIYVHILQFSVWTYNLYPEFPLYVKLYHKCLDSYLCVDYFFIVGGFFLYRTLLKKNLSTLEYAKNRFIRLWPLLALSIFLFWVLSLFNICNFYSYGNLLSLFFLYDSFFKEHLVDFYFNNGCSWFICSLFWCSIFYHYLYKNFDKKATNLIIALIICYSYTTILNYSEGTITGVSFKTISGMSGGLLRGLGGLGLGYFIGMFWQNFGNKIQNVEIKSKLKAAFVFLTVSALEIYIFIFLIYNSLFHQISYRNDFVLILIFCILFVSFLAQKGLLSMLLDNKLSEFLGKYAYSIYIMQGIGLAIANYFIWSNKAFVLSHPYLNIAATMLICVLIGVLPPPPKRLTPERLRHIHQSILFLLNKKFLYHLHSNFKLT